MGFLVRLELENFKSYKGHQVIGPLKPFTAVIGPNGAGKSNLMDAISFVLGEKTQHLRVKTVKDLIHGAPIGKPVASRAKVTAVYGEEDGTEIHFSRIIIPPSTEYRIDGKVVSHSQYKEQLEALGILIKAKNFLVFQGAVEAIAMKNPKERTQLFEEISHSGELAEEYERCKAEMTKSQDETNFTFQKKKGVTMEKKEAKAEKEEAEKYKKLQEELAENQLEEQLFLLYHNERQTNELLQDIKSKQKELTGLTNRQQKIEGQLKAKKQGGAKFTREMSLIEKTVREKEVDLVKKKPLYIKAKERTLHVVKRLEASKKAHKKAVELHEKHKDEIKALEAELQEVRRCAQQYEEELADSQSQDLQLLDSQVSEYHHLKGAVVKQSSALGQKMERLNQEQRTDEEALEQAAMKKEELLNRQAQLKEQRSLHEQRVEKLDAYISTNNQTIVKLRAEHQKLSEEVTQANLRYRELNEALEGVQEKLKDVRVDTQESSSAQRRAEILDNLKRLYPGVYGRLIDLCEPVHKRYLIAVTKVLGRNMDAIVVDQHKTGKDCIQYIKDQHAPPCTFLPLDTIEAKPTNEALRELGGSAKPVIDIIHFNPPAIKRALQYACGNAVVCDTMEEARKVAFGGSERRKAVSLDGTLFQKSGVISGGASDIKAKAKRWDEKQVDGLKKQRDRCLDELKDITQVRRKEPELQNLQSQITGLETRLKFSKTDRDVTLEQSLAENARELEVVEKELEAMEPRIANIEVSINARKGEIIKLQSKINKVEDQVFEEFCNSIGVPNIRHFEEKQLKGQQEKAQKQLEFSNQESRLKNQLEYERKRDTLANLKKLTASITTDESSIATLQKDEEEMLKDIESVEQSIEELNAQKQKIRKDMEEQDIESKELRKMLGTAMKDAASLQKAITAKEAEVDQKKADRHSLLKTCKMEDIKLTMLSGSMDDIGDEERTAPNTQTSEVGSSLAAMDIDSISSQGAQMVYERESRLEIDYSSLDDKLKELDNDTEVLNMAKELNANVSKLQTTLQRINAPNMKALEKLEGVEARLQETVSAFEKSRESARKAKADFEKVKKDRYDRFTDAFEHVSTVIDDIYKKLSNNTSAQAFLGTENAEEPYLEGVNYNCIAPGKRYRPMDNLSGGEKTVAALALLFAIHSYQPAPFFVLDEIDAALDNTNISRVANYITEQTRTSFQCIVISLKEEFYSHADALVGIYCEVGGDCTVSCILTHDLTQYPVTTSEASPTKAIRVR